MSASPKSPLPAEVDEHAIPLRAKADDHLTAISFDQEAGPGSLQNLSPSENAPLDGTSSEARPARSTSESTDAPSFSSDPADSPVAAPPLPIEPEPQPEQDDGWLCQWDSSSQLWYFYNRFTNQTQWENPRLQSRSPAANTAAEGPAAAPPPLPNLAPISGYNPAVHGDYDPNAWYAQCKTYGDDDDAGHATIATATANLHDFESEANGDMATVAADFNRFTGRFQEFGTGPERHTDDAKSRRQMSAFFDMDTAANAHDGRSLRAERAGRKPTKTELKQFKEKRKARKEEKRRAWLRD